MKDLGKLKILFYFYHMNWNSYFDKVLNSGFRSSAMTPLLWLNGLITLPCFVIGFWSTDNVMKWIPVSVAVIVVFYTLYKYNYLVNKDPKLVQSEKFQIISQKLDIISQKGGDIEFENVDLTTVDSAYLIENRDIEKKEDRE